MNGRIVKQDGGRYIVFDDLPRVKLVSEIDDETIAQNGGKIIKKAKKRAIKRLNKKAAKSSRKKKKTTNKRTVRGKVKFPEGSKPSLSVGGVTGGPSGDNSLSSLMAQQSLQRYSQPLQSPLRSIEAPKSEKKEENKGKVRIMPAKPGDVVIERFGKDPELVTQEEVDLFIKPLMCTKKNKKRPKN